MFYSQSNVNGHWEGCFPYTNTRILHYYTKFRICAIIKLFSHGGLSFMSLYAVIGDIHGPWEDEKAVDLFLYICKDMEITHLVFNGDVLDFYNINSHGPKDPEIQTSLEDEMNWGKAFFKRVRKMLPDVKIVFLYGNHEDRLNRFIMKNCPAFTNMLRLENQLELDKLDIEWYPYNERYRIGETDLFIQHSPPSYSENAANTSLKHKIDQDHIWGCSHRTDMVARTGSSGKVYTSYINGWFGSKKIVDYNQRLMPDNKRVYKFTKNHERWNCSFCLVTTDKKKHHVQQIIIKDYQCAIGCEIYQG